MEDIRDIIKKKAVENLKKSAFAKEHPGCLVVDAECQLPTEAQKGALCIVRRPEHYIGRGQKIQQYKCITFLYRQFFN